MADRSNGFDRDVARQRPREIRTSHESDASNAEDRHPKIEGCLRSEVILFDTVMDSTKPKSKTIGEYLARVNADQRDALGKVRQTVHTVAPQAQECISYGIPAFRLG